jgi:dihydroxyacetone kinase-like predicted kinase
VLPVRPGRAVVAVATGPGLEHLYAEAGAHVVPAGPTRRATTEDLIEGIEQTDAGEIVLLPNDAASRAAADAAAVEARQHGRRVAVVPVSTSVQALAAMAVHDPTAPFEDDVIAMTSAGRHARHGGLTVATREGVTSAGVCKIGDVLGVVDGDFVVIGENVSDVARHVADLMLSSGGDLVTLIVGEEADESLAADLQSYLLATRPALDVAVHEGGQPRYPLLIGVE